jgi:hypothetical protein
MKKITQFWITILIIFCIGSAAGQSWDYEFKFLNVFQPTATAYIVEQTNAVRFDEGSVKYWKPSANNLEARITQRFSFSAASTQISLKAYLSLYNGSATLWGSTDGSNWILIKTAIVAGDGAYEGNLPESLIGSSTLWIQARLLSINSTIEAQFLRHDDADPRDVFSLRVSFSPLFKSLVAYYPFNGNADDASGNYNDGNPGTAQLVVDRLGVPQSAYFFNGSNSFITFPKIPTTNTENISMFCWLKPNLLPQWGIAVKLGYSDGNLPCNGYALGIGSAQSQIGNHLIAENACVNWVDGIVSFRATNDWHHVGLVRQGGSDFIYLDGLLVSAQQISAPAPPTHFAIGTLLGSDQSNAIFHGSIDEVRVYNRSLTASEVQQLFYFEAGPRLGIVKAVKPKFFNLTMGTNYQLQISTDMNSWSNYALPFIATNGSVEFPQYWDVDEWNRLFFRLQVSP